LNKEFKLIDDYKQSKNKQDIKRNEQQKKIKKLKERLKELG